MPKAKTVDLLRISDYKNILTKDYVPGQGYLNIYNDSINKTIILWSLILIIRQMHVTLKLDT